MTEKEIDVVAEELARMGGNSWYPRRGQDPILRVVSKRYRERAQAAIAVLDRYRSRLSTPPDDHQGAGLDKSGRLRPGTTVIYRPPGDRRTYSCIVDQVSSDAVHVIPQIPGSDGWIRGSGIVTRDVIKNLEDQPTAPVIPSQALPQSPDSGSPDASP